MNGSSTGFVGLNVRLTYLHQSSIIFNVCCILSDTAAAYFPVMSAVIYLSMFLHDLKRFCLSSDNEHLSNFYLCLYIRTVSREYFVLFFLIFFRQIFSSTLKRNKDISKIFIKTCYFRDNTQKKLLNSQEETSMFIFRLVSRTKYLPFHISNKVGKQTGGNLFEKCHSLD